MKIELCEQYSWNEGNYYSVITCLFLLGRVIGAVIVIGGLYMILWGKSIDNSPLESTKEVLAPKTEEDHMSETNKSLKIHIQELEAIDANRVNSRVESV